MTSGLPGTDYWSPDLGRRPRRLKSVVRAVLRFPPTLGVLACLAYFDGPIQDQRVGSQQLFERETISNPGNDSVRHLVQKSQKLIELPHGDREVIEMTPGSCDRM